MQDLARHEPTVHTDLEAMPLERHCSRSASHSATATSGLRVSGSLSQFLTSLPGRVRNSMLRATRGKGPPYLPLPTYPGHPPLIDL